MVEVKLNINNRYFWGGLLLVLILLTCAFFIKYNNFKNDRGIENIQATYHALLTINSLSSLPVNESALLPTVNFSGDINKNIPWAAAVKTSEGNYIYTSFPSLGFVAPYVTLRALNAALSMKNLFLFNSALSVLTTTVFFTMVYLLTSTCSSEIRKSIAAVAGCSVLIFSCESLVSSGLVYWPHALSQLIIAVILLLFVIRGDKNNNIVDIALFLSLLAFSMTEWTGYVFCALLVVYLFIVKPEDWKRISYICISSSLLAIIIFAMQIEMVISLDEFFRTSIERFSARSSSKANLSKLLEGYWVSFGIYLIFIIPFIIYLKDKRYRFLLILCVFPMFENVILAQHATAFTFDRWKFAFLIGTSIALMCSQGSFKLIIAVMLAVLAALCGVWKYQSRIDTFSTWTDADKKNKALVSATSQLTNFGCAEIFSDTRVRGYPVMLFMRGIHEGMPTHPFEVMHNNKNVCSVIILHGDMPTPDMPEFHSIEVWERGKNSPYILK